MKAKMHIGILSARSTRYHPNGRLMEAASKLGHKISLIHPKNCLSEIGLKNFGLETLGLKGQPDALLPRIGATINEYALALIRQFELTGLPVINGFQSVLLARNNFLSLQALAQNGIPVPNSHYVSNFKNFERVVKKLRGYPVVAKTLNSRQGKGVILVDSPTTGQFIMDNLPDKRQGLLVQEYLPPQGRKDIRAFVLGDQVIGAMELKPAEGEFRSNVNLSAVSRSVTLTPELKEMAITSAKALGLEISGTDIILDSRSVAKVIEVNYSPGFKGLEASTGLDIASQIIRYVVRTYGGAA